MCEQLYYTTKQKNYLNEAQYNIINSSSKKGFSQITKEAHKAFNITETLKKILWQDQQSQTKEWGIW